MSSRRRMATDVHFLCHHCTQHKRVDWYSPLAERYVCDLECTHQVIATHSQLFGQTGAGMNMNRGTTQKKCEVCNDPYISAMIGLLGDICGACKAQYGVNTLSDARSLLDDLTDVPVETRRGMARVWADEQDKIAASGGHIYRSQPARVTTPAVPPAPPPDPERVATVVRSMIDYGRTTHSEGNATQPLSYVIGKSGLFEVLATDIATIVNVAPKEIKGITKDLKPGVTLNIPQVPAEILSQTVAFFREVSKTSSNEAIVQIFLRVSDRTFHVHIPEQQVSGASVRHTGFAEADNRDEQGNAIWLHVADIHSHGSTMSAFWSSVDDADEQKAPAGRMFGVIGKVNQAVPDWKWRMRAQGGFIDLKVDDMFAFDESRQYAFHVSHKTLMSCLKNETSIKDGMVRLDCPVDPFAGATFPPEWLDKVKGYAMTQWRGHAGSGHAANSPRFPEFSHTPGTGSRPVFIYVLQGNTLQEFEVKKGEGGKEIADPTGAALTLPVDEPGASTR